MAKKLGREGNDDLEFGARRRIDKNDVQTKEGYARLKRFTAKSLVEHRQTLKDLEHLIDGVEQIDLGERDEELHNLLEEMAGEKLASTKKSIRILEEAKVEYERRGY